MYDTQVVYGGQYRKRYLSPLAA